MKPGRFALLFLVVLSLLVVACAPPATPAPAAQPPVQEPAAEPTAEAAAEPAAASGALSGEIVVGCAHALSGPIAIYGEPIHNGILLAAQQINDQKLLGDATLAIVCEDTAGDKAQAINAFQKLINQDKVVAILGPTLSNSAFAADPVAQEAGIPVLGSSNTAAGITDMGDYVFRDSLPESDVIPNTILVTKDKLGYSKVAVMYGNDDQFTQSGYDVFAEALAGSGTEVVATETFAKGDTDFSAQLTKIAALEPEALIVSALAEEAANIMIQARQLGLDVPIIGGNGFNSPKLAEIAGPAAEGAISGAAWNIGNPAPENQAFVDAYRAAYGGDPDQFAAQAYTATWLMATAIKNAGSADPAAIRDALAAITDFPSPLGTYSFDANRNPVHTPVVLIVKDGKFQVFE
ncbi:MAG: ABC transporter substrate-binding protein [Anaerolineae bacterium]|nr:ABC transporter substrate-binding protein [Anaerolineae bacterium]MCB9132229.1 ABC transporter substrate-binding protein [Anaerolineales bacterium]MCO5246379.1 ABC transporter substrate-binding protein [Anaerolineae bacterium]